MSKLLRHRSARTIPCFYCQSLQQPRDPRSFKCLECSCWNRYDRNGVIMSDDPAMHDESLNTASFARRGAFSLCPARRPAVDWGLFGIASPQKDRLPSMYSQRTQSPFCHECQTNQTLISNLMSNYLPSQDVRFTARHCSPLLLILNLVCATT